MAKEGYGSAANVCVSMHAVGVYKCAAEVNSSLTIDSSKSRAGPGADHLTYL